MKTLPFELFENPRQSAAVGSTVDNPLSVLGLTLRTRDVVESNRDVARHLVTHGIEGPLQLGC